MPTTLVAFEPDERIRAAARAALGHPLCPECWGRLFGRLGHGLSNPQRAERLATALDAPLPSAGERCELCAGAFARLPTWVERTVRAAEGLEWHRFTCGSRWDPELLAREEAVWAEVRTARTSSSWPISP